MRPRDIRSADLPRLAVRQIGHYLTLASAGPPALDTRERARAALVASATLTAEALADIERAAPAHAHACRTAAAELASAALALRVSAADRLTDAARLAADRLTDAADGGDDAS